MKGTLLVGMVLALTAIGPAQAAFEGLGGTTRASSMSQAYVVHASDAGALWYNPAGLARGQDRLVEADYARLYPGLDVGPDISTWSLNYTQALAGGRLGVAVAGLGADIYSENGLIIGYGRGVLAGGHAGLGVRVLRWSADGYQGDADRSGTGIAIDLGFRYDVWRLPEGTLSLAAAVLGVNEPDVSESGGGTGIPRQVLLGFGYEDAHYAVEADWETVDGDARLRVGGEYKVGGRYDMRLRLGASGMNKDEHSGQVDGGIGLRMGSVVIDYAYHDSSQISGLGTQRLSLGCRF
jgi:hypothetical protein